VIQYKINSLLEKKKCLLTTKRNQFYVPNPKVRKKSTRLCCNNRPRVLQKQFKNCHGSQSALDLFKNRVEKNMSKDWFYSCSILQFHS